LSASKSAPGPLEPRRLWARDELARTLAGMRTRTPGLKVVLANGCFDLLHVGHLRYLRGARALGDRLVVALNSDASVRALKGPGRPWVTLAERAELLLGLESVDAAVVFEEADLSATLRLLRPAVHAKGSDYTLETVPEAALDRELGITVAITGDPKDHASSALAARIARAQDFNG